MVVRHGMMLAGIGIVVGLGGAAAGTRLMARLLFGVTATDPATFIAAAAASLSHLWRRRASRRCVPPASLRYRASVHQRRLIVCELTTLAARNVVPLATLRSDD